MRFNPEPLDIKISKIALPPQGAPLTQKQAQDLASLLAYQGLGLVSPNPLVGAVILDEDHRFLAGGSHLVYGGPHAEAHALDMLISSNQESMLKNATLYVTLEPCAHEGKTPSCAKRIAKLPFKEVIYGSHDPNPLVNGEGAKIINGAGIICRHDEKWKCETDRIAEIFLHVIREKRPFIGLKVGASLDGGIARKGDQRVWITGERSRQYAHFLRQVYDGIIIGANTVLADNPTLNVRSPWVKNPRTPWRIVLDPNARLLTDQKTFEDLNLVKFEPHKTLWVLRSDLSDLSKVSNQLRSRKIEWLEVPLLNNSGFDLAFLSRALFNKGCQSLLLEGGAFVYGAFQNQRLIDKYHLFQAPKLFGEGEQVIRWNEKFSSKESFPWRDLSLTILDDDVLWEGYSKQ